MGGEAVIYSDGETNFTGYLVDGSKKDSPKPGVLVFHGGAGLDDHARFQAERYASLGYVALAADLYGDEARTRDTIIAAIGNLREDRDLLARRANAARETLRAHPKSDGRVGVVGFCFGGMAALEYARSGAAVAAAVSIHGSLATTAPAVRDEIRAALLVCHGAADPHVPLDQVSGFMTEMANAAAHWEIDIYGGAVHGFTHRDAVGPAAQPGVAYEERADRLSFERVTRFFEEMLV